MSSTKVASKAASKASQASKVADVKSELATRGDHEFLFTYQEEPHRTRRAQIIQAHPEVTKLVGHEPRTKYVVFGVVSLQLLTAYLLRNSSPASWQFWVGAYVIGATCDSNLFLAIHELSHNLGFKKPLHNKLFSIFANIPVGIPYSAGFGPYHQLHHKHQGEPDYDTDMPTKFEALVLSSVAGKAFFATFQILFYAIRPMCIVKLDFTWVHLLNIAAQVAVDAVIVSLWGVTSLWYLIASAFLAGSLHPIAGHFIAEHYVFAPPKTYDLFNTPLPETYSYYGPLNFFVYNAGYHNEHHDFPYIPWTRIKELHAIAAEFYDPLPHYTSWVKVLYTFVFDSDVTLWNRVQRPNSNGPRLPQAAPSVPADEALKKDH